MHGAVGIKPFGVLAHDHEIDVAAAARRQARPRPRRPDIGEQVEPAAQLAGRIEPALAHRRIVVVRHRAEDDAGSLLGLLDHRVGNRGAGVVERGEADIGGLVSEAEPEPPVCGLEHFDGRGDDLRADAVARQHQQGGRARPLPAGFHICQELLLRHPACKVWRGETRTGRRPQGRRGGTGGAPLEMPLNAARPVAPGRLAPFDAAPLVVRCSRSPEHP
jgi:hypothetical protein